MQKLHASLALISVTLAVGALLTSSAALAGPHHHRPGPGWGHRPPMHRPVPPPPPPRHRHHRSMHPAWIWAPVAAGITFYGLHHWLERDARYQADRAALAAQRAEAAAQAAQTTQPATVYWCQAEQGFYPQVRACPTGWVALPASAVAP